MNQKNKTETGSVTPLKRLVDARPEDPQSPVSIPSDEELIEHSQEKQQLPDADSHASKADSPSAEPTSAGMIDPRERVQDPSQTS